MTIEDSGDSQETSIPVTLTITQSRGGNITLKKTIPFINPGQQTAVTFTNIPAVNFSTAGDGEGRGAAGRGREQHQQQLRRLPGHLLGLAAFGRVSMFWPWEVVGATTRSSMSGSRPSSSAFKRALLGWRSSSVAGSERGAVSDGRRMNVSSATAAWIAIGAAVAAVLALIAVLWVVTRVRRVRGRPRPVLLGDGKTDLVDFAVSLQGRDRRLAPRRGRDRGGPRARRPASRRTP